MPLLRYNNCHFKNALYNYLYEKEHLKQKARKSQFAL